MTLVAALLALLRLFTCAAHLQVVPSPVFGGFPVQNLISVLFSGMCCLVPGECLKLLNSKFTKVVGTKLLAKKGSF